MTSFPPFFRVSSLLLLSLLIIPSTGVPVLQADAADGLPVQEVRIGDLARGEHALLEGDLDRAIGLLTSAAQGPDREKALYRLAGALASADRHEEALSTLESLLEGYPGGPFFHKTRFLEARALESLKRYQEASLIYQEEVTRLLSKERKEEVAHFYIRYAQAQADPKREGGPQYAKAVELYRHALNLEIPGPLDEDIRLRIADLQHKLAQFQEEEKTLNEFS